MGRKIVFFDIDGTIYAHDIGVPRSTIDAIEKLLENDHIPVLSTVGLVLLSTEFNRYRI